MSWSAAVAECRARGLGPEACADLAAPFCNGQVAASSRAPFVVCRSARKAAILAAEARARGEAGAPGSPNGWGGFCLALGAAAAAVGVGVVLERR